MRDKSQANYDIKNTKIKQKRKIQPTCRLWKPYYSTLCWSRIPPLAESESRITSICLINANHNQHVVCDMLLVMLCDTFQLEMRFTSFWHLTVKRVKEQSFLQNDRRNNYTWLGLLDLICSSSATTVTSVLTWMLRIVITVKLAGLDFSVLFKIIYCNAGMALNILFNV